MSRIGKTPITIPENVKVNINNQDVHVKGKLGELSYTMMEGISITDENSVLKIQRSDDSRNQRALHGLTRALINNMIIGVSEGYEKTLHVVGTGYSAELLAPWLRLSLGYSHDILVQIPENLKVSVEAVPRTRGSASAVQSIIKISGINKEIVGQFSAEVRKCREPENYKGKGIRYHDEYVKIKPGKAGAK